MAPGPHLGEGEGVDLAAGAEALRRRLPVPPRVFLVLGSGLGAVAGEVDGAVTVPFRAVPGLPPPRVPGHPGVFVGGRLEGLGVLVQLGRLHLYEGHAPGVVAAPVRIAGALGAQVAVLTAAAGGLSPRLRPGEILLLGDHLNLQWRNPLAGPVLPGEARFPDMSAPYDPGLQEAAQAEARSLGIPLARGTYGAVLGPSYETPAEAEVLRRAGAEAVGMSTVPEVLAARARGMRVVAFAVITNAVGGRAPLSHREVVAAAEAAAPRLAALIRGVLRRLPREGGRSG